MDDTGVHNDEECDRITELREEYKALQSRANLVGEISYRFIRLEFPTLNGRELWIREGWQIAVSKVGEDQKDDLIGSLRGSGLGELLAALGKAGVGVVPVGHA